MKGALKEWLSKAGTLGCACVMAIAACGEPVTVRPLDHGKALVNPRMGWTFHHYSNIIENYGSKLEPSDLLTDFPGLSTIYLRLPWSFIEPEEGVLDWSIVDAPAQRWIDAGLQVAFRFTCSESWMRYATPQWVEQAGAKGHNFTFGKGVVDDGVFWEPDYNDPVFLKKLENFIEKAAARYDGNPHVAFMDIGSFGVWGEGHTFASSRLEYPCETIQRHIDLYAKYFIKTLLAANDDFAFQGDCWILPASQRGITLRDDSILVQPPPKSYFHAEMAQMFWPRSPVILENEHYGGSKDRGAWGDGSLLLKAVEEYHASYASIHWWPRQFLEEQRSLIDRINLRLGYRLQLREATWPKQVTLNSRFKIEMKWANAGVAPCYPGGHPAMTLKDAQGGVVAVLPDSEFNVRDLIPGPPGEAPIQQVEWTAAFARNMKAGVYEVYVSVGSLDGKPQIALPIEGGDNHRRYHLGQIEVVDP